jgi:hypothetical protein
LQKQILLFLSALELHVACSLAFAFHLSSICIIYIRCCNQGATRFSFPKENRR